VSRQHAAVRHHTARASVTTSTVQASTSGGAPGAPAPIDPTTTPHVRTKVCTPTKPPVDPVAVVVRIGSAAVYGTDGSGDWQPVAATPHIVVRAAAGCAAIGSHPAH
jgi:hypothetical protein